MTKFIKQFENGEWVRKYKIGDVLSTEKSALLGLLRHWGPSNNYRLNKMLRHQYGAYYSIDELRQLAEILRMKYEGVINYIDVLEEDEKCERDLVCSGELKREA